MSLSENHPVITSCVKKSQTRMNGAFQTPTGGIKYGKGSNV